MLADLFAYKFIMYALITSVLSSILCGIIGVIIIEKKLVMMSGGIAHTAFGGVGLGYLLNFTPIIGAFGFAVISSLGIGYIKRKGGTRSDVIIGLLWSFGMACGIFFMGLTKGFPPIISSYLFGNILSVTFFDIIMMLILTFIVVFIIISFFSHWKAYLFDDEFSSVTGVNTSFLEYLLLILVSMTVVVLIRAVGIILVMALLTAPAATASFFTKKLQTRMVLSVVISLFFTVSGLFLSNFFKIASGATIVFVSVITYFTAYITMTMKNKRNKKLSVKKNAV